jgi:hypothetical protein
MYTVRFICYYLPNSCLLFIVIGIIQELKVTFIPEACMKIDRPGGSEDFFTAGWQGAWPSEISARRESDAPGG